MLRRALIPAALLVTSLVLAIAPADAQVPPLPPDGTVPDATWVVITQFPGAPFPVVQAAEGCTVSVASNWAEATCTTLLFHAAPHAYRNTELQPTCYSPYVQATADSGWATGWVGCDGAPLTFVHATAPDTSIAARGPSGEIPYVCGGEFGGSTAEDLPDPYLDDLEVLAMGQVTCYGPDP